MKNIFTLATLATVGVVCLTAGATTAHGMLATAGMVMCFAALTATILVTEYKGEQDV